MFVTIISFAVILGFMIFIHEMGHFVVARIMGVKAEEFGFGFPPRIVGIVFNARNKKWELIKGNKKIGKRKNTIYSLNWIPLGGFVKILGEDGGEEPDSKTKPKTKKNSENFSFQPIWKRVAILIAGVAMNFIGAIIILSLGFYIGLPQAVDDGVTALKDPKVQVVDVAKDSPASAMKIEPGDQLIAIASRGEMQKISDVSDAVAFLNNHAGEEIVIEVKRGDDISYLTGTPRADHPEKEGALGVVLTKTAIVSYPPLTAIKMGTTYAFDIASLIIGSLGSLLKDLVTTGRTSADVSGPVGIFMFADQAAELGFAYLLQFAAVLSINLAIINILPIPALDGGRILFLLIEKIKKSPVSLGLEQKIHIVGFYLLITLMIAVTIKDLLKFKSTFAELFQKILGYF